MEFNHQTISSSQGVSQGVSHTFVLENQDHTLGTILQYELLQDPRVLFAAYRQEHPNTRKIHLRIDVQPNSAYNPRSVLLDAIEKARKCVMQLFGDIVQIK